MSITDIIINDALAEQWAKTPEGQERLKRWIEINTYYAIATISATAVDIAVQKFGRRVINNTTEFDTFTNELMGLNGAGKFIAISGNDLKTHLKSIVNKPLGKSYNSDLVRSLSKTSELNFGAMPKDMTDHLIYSSWGRYDLDGAENAMYLSKDIIGNKTEITHYGNWEDYNTYNFSNVEINNLLDLTDDAVRKQLKVDFNQLVKTTGEKEEIYEFTNVLASWAREKGYNGLIVPGARGLKDYDNVVLFDQAYIKNILKGKIPKLLNKTSGQWNVRSLDRIIEEYPLLKSQWEKLPTNELKAMFQKDFENATESILKQLNKDNSIIFKGWLKFRLKHPTKIICIQ